MLRLAQALRARRRSARARRPSSLATIGAGLGLRAVARQLLGLIPVAGWAVQGAVAYAGTRALGEAAISGSKSGLQAAMWSSYAAAGRSFARRARSRAAAGLSRAHAHGSTSR